MQHRGLGNVEAECSGSRTPVRDLRQHANRQTSIALGHWCAGGGNLAVSRSRDEQRGKTIYMGSLEKPGWCGALFQATLFLKTSARKKSEARSPRQGAGLATKKIKCSGANECAAAR